MKLEKSIQEEAEKLLKELIELVEKEIAAAKEKIEEIIAAIDQVAEQAIGAAQQAIQNEIEKLTNALEQLQNEFGDKVADCLKAEEEHIAGLPEKTLNEIISCVTNKVNEAKQIINAIVADIEAIPQIISKIEEDLKNCTDVLCYGKVVAEASKAIAQIPIDVAAQIKKATDLIQNLKIDLVACATGKLAGLSQEVAGIIAKVTTCALEI